MFQNRRQSALSNISLGNLSTPPGYEDMEFLLEQAAKYRGRFVEICWVVPKTTVPFQLTAKYVPQQPLPVWMLYRGNVGASELVWGHHSSDITLMHNLVMLECEKPAGAGGNAISSNAMESLVTTNRAAGAIAGAPIESLFGAMAGGAAATSAAHKTQAPPPLPGMAPPAPAPSGPSDPTSTWLRNVGPDPTLPPQEQLVNKLAQSALPQSAVAAPQARPATGLQDTQDIPPLPDLFEPDMLLDGSLANITVPRLLDYLSKNQLTGRLALQSSIGSAEVFFQDGELKHAAALDSKGENALLDAATWTDGDFNFNKGEQARQNSLTLPTRDMIMVCDRMIEYSRFLNSAGVRTSSYLSRAQEVTPAQFEQRVKEGAPLDAHQMWRIYETIDGNGTLFDVIRACPMTRAEWIPILYTLVSSGLVTVLDRPVNPNPGMFLQGMPMDEEAIGAFVAANSQVREGVLNRNAFLFMLQQEFYRYERTGSRFALAIFSFATTNKLNGDAMELSTDAMREASKRLLQAKRRLDLIGHFEGNDYAILLPETDSIGAAVFANRIVHQMKKKGLKDVAADQEVSSSFGIAGIPDDVRDLSALVAAARAAKSRSKLMGLPVCLYAET